VNINAAPCQGLYPCTAQRSCCWVAPHQQGQK